MTPRQLTGLAGAAFVAGVYIGFGTVPYGSSHGLTAACVWQKRAWVDVARLALLPVPDGEPGPRDDAARERCWMGRGLASPTPYVKTILARWPSEAELTAWREDDAGGVHAH